MNDYSFGNRLLALRTRCGLTQTALGERLGVSGKAVSYLTSADGEEVRVRQCGLGGSYIYCQTTKRRVSGLKRIETERRLTQAEYLTLLMEADPASGRYARRDTASAMKISISR